MSTLPYVSPIEHAVSVARAGRVVLYIDRVKSIDALVGQMAGRLELRSGERLIRANGRQQFTSATGGRIRFLHTASSARGFSADVAFLPDHIRSSPDRMAELMPSLDGSTILGGPYIYAIFERVDG